uniref:Zinc finger protein LOC723797 n=1 Tax=Phallusia mammillata TaxID=59560 RepID=A0A6F9DXW6_9ASCI|nr:zinc finger protein LOC723797 [Phallusia mammillata]
MDLETTNKSCNPQWTCRHCNKTFTAERSLKRHTRQSCPNSSVAITLARCPSCGITCTARSYSRHFSNCSKVWGVFFRSTNTKEAEIKNTEITTSQTLSNSSQTTKPSEPQKKISFNATQQRPIEQWFKKSVSHANQYHSEVSINVDDTNSSDSSNNDFKDDGEDKEKLAPLSRRFKVNEKAQVDPQSVQKSSKAARLPSSESNQAKLKSEYRETRLQGCQVLEALTNQLASLQQNAIMVFR